MGRRKTTSDPKPRIWNAAAYCRLSREDGDKIESNMCKVTGGNSQSGYTVQVYPNGRWDEGGTESSATLFVPDIALDSDLPSGTWIIGHKALLPATGGNDE